MKQTRREFIKTNAVAATAAAAGITIPGVSAAAAGDGGYKGGDYGSEQEVYSLLIIDQHTFEVRKMLWVDLS